mmetsp:Transcript_18720/g.35095  ORF Transcript_18720/g.35095 Transcript_18720/m.35095 type:complete len:471 (-) Transcript_18720:58-1470(-)
MVGDASDKRLMSETDYADDINVMWLLIGAVLVFFMQTGFAMLEVGSVALKNTKNVLVKNIFDCAIGCMMFWWIGYGLAFGDSAGRVVGSSLFAFSGEEWDDGSQYARWLFQWAFAATSTTIVSGTLLERATFHGYLLYSVWLSGVVYPVVVHWAWSGEGWASPRADDPLFGCGLTDYAGSSVVHVTGGLAALVGAVFVGARTGRFNYDGTANEMNEQNPVIQTLGTIFMWFGWFGFNGASARTLTGHGGSVARSMAMTALCPSTCAITAVLLGMWRKGFIDQKLANNGILAGCVAISAGCATVRGEGAFVIGVLAAPTFYFAQELLLRLKLDDVVNAIPVHLAAGVLGTVLTGFFAHPDNYERAYGASGERARRCAGVLYGGAGYGLAANLVALLAQLAWVGLMSALCYWSIGKLVGLRVSREMEEVGMDRSKHGGIIGQEEHYNPGDTDHIQNFLNVFMTRKVAKSEKS